MVFFQLFDLKLMTNQTKNGNEIMVTRNRFLFEVKLNMFVLSTTQCTHENTHTHRSINQRIAFKANKKSNWSMKFDLSVLFSFFCFDFFNFIFVFIQLFGEREKI